MCHSEERSDEESLLVAMLLWLRFFASLRMTGTRSVLFTGNFSKLPAPLKIQLMAACLQAIVRGMFEDLRGYKLSYIAAQIKVRSTLQNKRKP